MSQDGQPCTTGTDDQAANARVNQVSEVLSRVPWPTPPRMSGPERERQPWLVSTSLRRVDRLPRDAGPLGEPRLRRSKFSALLRQNILQDVAMFSRGAVSTCH